MAINAGVLELEVSLGTFLHMQRHMMAMKTYHRTVLKQVIGDPLQGFRQEPANVLQQDKFPRGDSKLTAGHQSADEICRTV